MSNRTSARPPAGLATIGGTDHMAPHLLAAASFLMQFTSKNTRSAYTTDLRIYFNWCAQQCVDPLTAKRFHLQAYALHLQEERYNKPATVGRRIGTLVGYYENAIVDGYLEATPMVRIRLPKIQDDPTSRVWLNRYEMATLLKVAKASSGADWAMVSLMGTIGMRATSVCDVNIEDISTTPDGYRILRFIGKGAKPCAKALPIPVVQAVDAAAAGRASGPLFVMRRKEARMTRRAAAARLEVLAARAEIVKKVTPHVLRRSCATLLLKNGVDIRVVQAQLDHSSERVTARYDALGVEIHAQAAHTMAAMLASSA